MEHCDGCKEDKARTSHRATMRNWVRTERVKIHSRYMASLAIFDTVYARPHKYTITEAQFVLSKANEPA